MIRLVDIQGDPIWLNPKQIDAIGLSGVFRTDYETTEGSKIVWHSGGSCMTIHMAEDLDKVKAMIDEASG